MQEIRYKLITDFHPDLEFAMQDVTPDEFNAVYEFVRGKLKQNLEKAVKETIDWCYIPGKQGTSLNGSAGCGSTKANARSEDLG